jgi:hypothetical protein
MPFKSQRQRRYMHANHPQIAKRWEQKYGGAQPYKRGARQPGAALSAMLRGKPTYLPNPQDVKRKAQRQARSRRRRV